jgi:AcrR family transcriptional regulator
MTSSTAANGPRRAGQRPHEGAISRAALDAFGAHGFNGASMREIASRAGTSLSNLYNYFPAKSDLLARILLDANEALILSLESADRAGDPDPAIRLGAVVSAYVEWTSGARTAGQVALSEFRYLDGSLRELVVESRDRTEQVFVEIVESGVRAGRFATPYPREAARGIVVQCAAMVTWYRPDGPHSAVEVAAGQARLALAMVEVVASG